MLLRPDCFARRVPTLRQPYRRLMTAESLPDPDAEINDYHSMQLHRFAVWISMFLCDMNKAGIVMIL